MLENFIITKKFLLFSASFIIGATTGYILGYNNIGLKDLNFFKNFLSNSGNSISSILSITPTPDFLSDIAAFEAVVIALAVPLSFEIVSRISERYQSEVITKQFIQEWEIKWLPGFLIINIFLAIGLRFFVQGEPSSGAWKILAWITFVSFLVIAMILFKFITKLKSYMTDTEFILKRLYDEAEKLLK